MSSNPNPKPVASDIATGFFYDSGMSYNFFAKLRIEKAGRGGKTVTVIDNLPKEIVFLKDLTKLLKNRCGSGGTFSMEGKEGLIEIQGDKRDQIRGILVERGIRFKG